MTETFSVVQFFKDGTHEYVRKQVSLEESVQAALHYTKSVAAQLGMVRQVLIIDSGDTTCFEWKYGEGVIFPVHFPQAKP